VSCDCEEDAESYAHEPCGEKRSHHVECRRVGTAAGGENSEGRRGDGPGTRGGSQGCVLTEGGWMESPVWKASAASDDRT
jgi:hypothetical protein